MFWAGAGAFWKEGKLFLAVGVLALLFSLPFNSYVPSNILFIQGDPVRYLLLAISYIIFNYSIIAIAPSFFSRHSNFFYLLIASLILVSLYFFLISDFFILYIIFEVSIIPIFLIIMGWGYQVERLVAGLRLFFYTLVASIPLLYRILSLFWVWGSLNFVGLFMLINVSRNNFFRICIILAFLVKLPIYGVHMWLPKAHVEAPVGGSIILAAVLLKLGGFGMIVARPLIFHFRVVTFLTRFSLVGAIIVRLICLRVADLKVLIAYSSVSHIRYLVFSIMLGYFQRFGGRVLIMIMHGFTSSGIFLLCNYFYLESKSRRLILNKGVLIFSQRITIIWFLILIRNMAAPPTLNFVSETLIIISIINFSWLSGILLVTTIVFASGYILLIYSRVSQGQPLISSQGFSCIGLSLRIRHILWVFTPLVLISLLKLRIYFF